jgi:NADH-quinone oxidoreductase subunit C
MTALEAANRVKTKFGDLLTGPLEFRGEVSLVIGDAQKIGEVCGFAKTMGFNYLVDISSVDNYGDDPRWTVVYHLRNIVTGIEIRLKTDVSEEKSELPSVTSLWRTANWHEREIYDMMGIRFSGHPDLRRILMWEGYPYHPLRKDFPLAGKPTDLPGVAFTRITPLEGGPFVTVPGPNDAIAREPRVRLPEDSGGKAPARLAAPTASSDTDRPAAQPGPLEKK